MSVHDFPLIFVESEEKKMRSDFNVLGYGASTIESYYERRTGE